MRRGSLVRHPAAVLHMGGLLGGKKLVWLLYDEFTTAESAPLTSPRTCEPGPGTLTLVDTGNNADIANGQSEWTGYVGAGDPRWYADLGQASRLVGLAAFTECSLDASAGHRLYFALHPSNVAAPQLSSFNLVGTQEKVYDNSNSIITGGTISDETLQSFLVILRSYGSFTVTDGKLRWVGFEYAGNSDWLIFAASVASSKTNAAKLGALSLPANNYTAWDADFSTVTDSESTPATGTTFDCAIDHHETFTFTHENLKYVQVSSRYTDDNNRINFVAATNGRCYLRKIVAGVTTALYDQVGAFADGVNYKIDVVTEGDAVSLYIDNVQVLSSGDVATVPKIAGGKVYHTLATNDIELSTHPLTLGIATDRVIAPQPSDTADCNSDCLVYWRNVTLAAAGNGEINFVRGNEAGVSASPWTYGVRILANGALKLIEYNAGGSDDRIAAAAGTVSDGDDVCLVMDGADSELFVNGTSAGTYGSTLYTTNTGYERWSSTEADATEDSIEFFPRDVTDLLPTELV